MEDNNHLYWIWLAEALGQGSRLSSKLVNLFENAREIYETPLPLITGKEGFSDNECSILKTRLSDRSLDLAKKIIADCDTLKIRILTPDDADFPKSLCALKDMPLVLYCKGTIPNKNERLFISIVGTRNMTDYGRKVAYSLGYGIALGGGVVVSGMALGSDSMAMAGAMDVGAPSIAVLGCGVDVIYPREHREMYYRIIANGAVISEYPPGTSPAGVHFPVRNRIISGLSEGTVVVEGNASSGSLITAKHAVEQGKKVFAVPGKVGEASSEGTLHLLYENALPCAKAEDVLEEFRFLYPRTVNVDLVHLKTRGIDFEKASEYAMNRFRIGVRGESQYYGTGTFGGRAKDFLKNGESKKEFRSDIRSTETDRRSSVQKVKISDTSSTKNSENAGRRSLFSAFSQKETKNIPERNTKSKEKNVNTTGFALNMLDEIDIKVYNSMQSNVPVLPDKLVNDTFSISDIMSALSTLELAGMVESSPGGYFTRVGENSPIMLIDDKTIE